jgi:hypothetical protein
MPDDPEIGGWRALPWFVGRTFSTERAPSLRCAKDGGPPVMPARVKAERACHRMGFGSES